MIQSPSMSRIAIIGRPNVGKSTLFNRLIGKRLALVDDQPGVTRDRREGMAKLGDLNFVVIDTAGLEDDKTVSLEGRMRQQTEKAVAESSAVLFLVDFRLGVTPLDREFARWIRRQGRPVILVANKAEGRVEAGKLGELYGLGLGDPVSISAEHGEGMADLFAALAPHVDKASPPSNDENELNEIATDIGISDQDAEDIILPDAPIQLAVVGRPNVGKSTLINQILGQNRLLTGPEAGITRDAIAIDWIFNNRKIRLIDTAGLRRRARVTDKLEKLSGADTLRAVRFAHVVILMTSAEEPMEKQDLTLARLVAEEGRAMVVAVNKWDTVKDHAAVLRDVRERIEDSLPQCKGMPIIPVSGMTGRGLSALLDACLDIYLTWNKRIATPQLNRWLRHVVDAHSPPAVTGRRIKLRFMTQTAVRPPRFVLFTSRPDALPDSYLRYLTNALRADFDLPGVPIRIVLRKGDNPYASRAES